MEIELEVFVIEEASGTIVPSLHKVQWDVVELDSGRSGHLASIGRQRGTAMTRRKHCPVSLKPWAKIAKLINPDPISGEILPN
jgi:hypothetical protein